MHFIFLIDQIYRQGGAEKVLTQKANYLVDKLNYKVTIITTEQQDKTPYFDLNVKVNLIDLGINYEREKSYFSLNNLKKAPLHFKALNRTLQDFKPDVVVLLNFSFDFYWLPFIYKKALKWKEFHSSRYFEFEKRATTKSIIRKIRYGFSDWIESNYDKIILLNPDEKKFYNTNNTVVVPNPVEQYGGQAALVSKQAIAAGRIAPVKGFDHLIQAWEIVNKAYPDWQLHIYGDSYLDTKEKLMKQIQAFNLEKVILFKESVSNIPETMLNYSIYAMSSVTECFPMVLLEALSVGLPVVSYDCPNGPRNIITNHEDGLLVESQNYNKLAKGLLAVIEDESLRITMGQNAKVNSMNFETEKVINRWLSNAQKLNKEEL